MQFTKIKLSDGQKINAITNENDITLYISKNNAVYKGTVKDYATMPVLQQPYLMVYCDEVCGLENGGYIERRGEKLKIIE